MDGTKVENWQYPVAMQIFLSLLILLLATAARIWPLGALGNSLTWVTFYPAVMVSALMGGAVTGLLVTVLSAVIVYFWSPTDTPFITKGGDFLGMAVFCFNGILISALAEATRRARRQAAQSSKEAYKASQAKSTFLANMSHELRTPLNAILGFTRVLQKSINLEPEQKRNLRIISTSGEHLLNLINNILDISKIEAGHMVKEVVSLNLNAFINDISALMAQQLHEKGLKLEIEKAPDLPAEVKMDESKLRQVLINLIGNACKFTEKGSVTLSVASVGSGGNQSIYLRFSVADTGRGISKEDQRKIFQPFYRAKVGGQNLVGTGLGLNICKQFVTFLGGKIMLESEEGKGSTFYFDIPASLPDASKSPSSKIQNKEVLGLMKGQPNLKLLIAEDKLENRLLLTSILKPLGFDLEEAMNAAEAVEVAKEWRPQLIFMDINMPGSSIKSGLDATRIIKADPDTKDIVIVAVTAHAMEEERREILDKGCDAFIRKPYREREIFAALATHLGVDFEYGEPEGEAVDIVSADTLAALPHEQLVALQYAVSLLDSEQSTAVINAIRKSFPEVGRRLLHMVDGMLFEELLSTLDKVLLEKIE